MKLTSKGRYAVTAILDIALHAGTDPVCLADISERQNISLSYLEQLFAKLRRGGLVKSVRGPGGGYRLALSADQISIGMVISAVNENINVTRCLGKGNCKGGQPASSNTPGHSSTSPPKASHPTRPPDTHSPTNSTTPFNDGCAYGSPSSPATNCHAYATPWGPISFTRPGFPPADACPSRSPP